MRQRAGSRAQIVDDRRPPKQKGSHGLRHGRAQPNAVDGVARKGAGESQGGGMTFRLRWKREEHVKVGESTPHRQGTQGGTGAGSPRRSAEGSLRTLCKEGSDSRRFFSCRKPTAEGLSRKVAAEA